MRVLFRSSTRTPDSRIEHLVSARRDPRRRIERRHIERAAEVGRVGAEAGIIAVAIEPVDDVVGAAGAVVADVAQIIRIVRIRPLAIEQRSEEHTSELQSLMRISYAVFCLKK